MTEVCITSRTAASPTGATLPEYPSAQAWARQHYTEGVDWARTELAGEQLDPRVQGAGDEAFAAASRAPRPSTTFRRCGGATGVSATPWKRRGRGAAPRGSGARLADRRLTMPTPSLKGDPQACHATVRVAALRDRQPYLTREPDLFEETLGPRAMYGPLEPIDAGAESTATFVAVVS